MLCWSHVPRKATAHVTVNEALLLPVFFHLKIFIIFNYVSVAGVMCACECSAMETEISNPLELETQAAVSHLKMELGTNPGPL